jgi:hypothetical protein
LTWVTRALPTLSPDRVVWAYQWVSDAPRPKGDVAVITIQPTGPEGRPSIDYTTAIYPTPDNSRRVQRTSIRMGAAVTVTLVGPGAYALYDALEPSLYRDDIQEHFRQSGVAVTAKENGVDDATELTDTVYLPVINRTYRAQWVSVTESPNPVIDYIATNPVFSETPEEEG